MTHPIGEVPHAGLDPELFDRFHQEMVAIKNTPIHNASRTKAIAKARCNLNGPPLIANTIKKVS